MKQQDKHLQIFFKSVQLLRIKSANDASQNDQKIKLEQIIEQQSFQKQFSIDFYIRLNMSHHCTDCKQKNSLFTDILKARKLKIERQKRVIDRVLQDKIRLIPQLNPEKKYKHNNPKIDSLEHYSDSDYSIDDSEYRIRISKKPKPRNHSPLRSSEQTLNERARNFINRLRKQKQYNEGKMLLMRKREEEKRQIQAQIRSAQRRSFQLVHRKEKINRLMDNIIFHQGKISERAVQSLKKQVRSKTENWDREDLTKSLNSKIDPTMQSLKKRVKELSEIIDSYR